MTDIFDIKPNSFLFPFDINFTLIYIVFIIIVVFLLKYKPKIKTEKKYIEEIHKPNFKELLQNIENNYLKSSKSVFYQNFKSLIILFVQEKINFQISSMTLKELDEIEFEIELKLLIKEIYFKQYNQEIYEDNIEYRKKLITNFEKYI